MIARVFESLKHYATLRLIHEIHINLAELSCIKITMLELTLLYKSLYSENCQLEMFFA
jgi:hypothetical protein